MAQIRPPTTLKSYFRLMALNGAKCPAYEIVL